LLELFDVTRTRKLVLPSSCTDQVLPQVSVEPPSTAVCSLVLSVLSVFAAVQEVPPSQESWTLMLLVPEVLSSHQSRRTSMPVTEESGGMEMP
jgi:hypothetical protein